jgi:hypothetical protein
LWTDGSEWLQNASEHKRITKNKKKETNKSQGKERERYEEVGGSGGGQW